MRKRKLGRSWSSLRQTDRQKEINMDKTRKKGISVLFKVDRQTEREIWIRKKNWVYLSFLR